MSTGRAAMTPEQAAASLEKQYKSQLDAQLKKAEAAYTQNANNYRSQLDKAPEAYQAMRNQAYTQNALAEQARKENMANMGLSGAGGTSQTLQQRNQTALLNAVGDISRQQQDYTDNINGSRQPGYAVQRRYLCAGAARQSSTPLMAYDHVAAADRATVELSEVFAGVGACRKAHYQGPVRAVDGIRLRR